MSEYVSQTDSEEWLCAACNTPLQIMPVQIGYMESAFPVDLPRCPNCGIVFIPESLAIGKMAEVEKSLEDK